MKSEPQIPLSPEHGKNLHFFFLGESQNKPDLEQLNVIKSESEKFELRKNIFYLYAPDGIGRSDLAAKVE